MDKKSLSTYIPESIKTAVDDLSEKTGRNKNILVRAALHHFLEADSGQQEAIIKRYLNAHPK